MSSEPGDNPYAPPPAPSLPGTRGGPSAAPPDTRSGRALARPSAAAGGRGFRPFAVVIGFLVDLGLTFVVSELLVKATAAHFDSVERLLDFWEGRGHRLLFLPFGAACSLVGGFVTGILARDREYLHGLANVAVSFGWFGYLFASGGISLEHDADLTLLEHACIVAAILLGSGLARQRRLARARRIAGVDIDG